jgi:hypothetical protein
MGTACFRRDTTTGRLNTEATHQELLRQALHCRASQSQRGWRAPTRKCSIGFHHFVGNILRQVRAEPARQARPLRSAVVHKGTEALKQQHGIKNSSGQT